MRPPRTGRRWIRSWVRSAGGWSGGAGGAAHIREVQRYAATLPDDTYGKQNRQHITTRETRIATRLRAIEHAYRTATERHAQSAAPETTTTHPALNREIELE